MQVDLFKETQDVSVGKAPINTLLTHDIVKSHIGERDGSVLDLGFGGFYIHDGKILPHAVNLFNFYGKNYFKLVGYDTFYINGQTHYDIDWSPERIRCELEKTLQLQNKINNGTSHADINNLELHIGRKDGDVTRIDLFGDGFDVVICSKILHFLHPTNRGQFVDKIWNCMNPGGLLHVVINEKGAYPLPKRQLLHILKDFDVVENSWAYDNYNGQIAAIFIKPTS